MAPILPLRASIRCHIALKLLRWLSMKSLVLAVVAAALTLPTVSPQTKAKQGTSGKHHTVILQSEGGSFTIEGPKDWIADRKVGRALVCAASITQEGRGTLRKP
jgi:hypothetical protein